MKSIFTTLLFCCLTTGMLSAQSSSNKDVMKDGSISEQFEYVTKKSNRYKDGEKRYRVVKEELLQELENNVDEEIKKLNLSLSNSNATIETQQSEVLSLKDQLKETNQDLEKVNKEKNNMAFLGTIPMKKAAYRTIMWAIVAALVAFLLFFIFSFIRSNVVTRQTQKKLETVREEFDAFRKKAMDDDQKLRRQLQDEINKRL